MADMSLYENDTVIIKFKSYMKADQKERIIKNIMEDLNKNKIAFVGPDIDVYIVRGFQGVIGHDK